MLSFRRSYYEVLNVDNEASLHDIRRAYAEAIEPSIANGSYGETEESKKMIDAYEILSDHRTRKFYDRYGTFGVIIRNTYTGRFLHPQLMGLSTKILLLRVILLLSLLYFFDKLAYEIDFVSEFNFGLMMIPLASILCLIFSFIIYILYCGSHRSFSTPGYVDFISPWLGDYTRFPTFTKFIRWHRIYLAEAGFSLLFLFILFLKLYIPDIPKTLLVSPVLIILYLERSYVLVIQLLIVALRLDIVDLSISWWILFSPTFVKILWEICSNVILCAVFLVFALHDRTVPTVGLHRHKLTAELIEQIVAYFLGLGLAGIFLMLLSEYLNGSEIAATMVLYPVCFGLKLMILHCILIPFIIYVAYFSAPTHPTETPAPVQFASVVERPPLHFIDDDDDESEDDPLIYSNSITGYGTGRIV